MAEYDFIFKPFEEMTPEDYERVGFKSGLEVHQQLLTEKKLFCHCPAGKYQSSYNAEILRHMRPTLSELGEYDGTALMEFKTKKDIIYRIHYDTVCTYEMDDTPPFLINDQALDIAIEVGMLFNGFIVDELHIARKQYLDGSIPTGFQRTAITCVGGKIPYKDRVINLIQMSIEEDSCREVSDVGHKRVYITDRLGMPLIETVTYPEMKTPQEVAEVNNILRRLVRSTGKVRTGIGAGREDVNVSVRGGTRIEIKGVPNIKRIPLLTYNEAMRQWNLLRLREVLAEKGITPDTFSAEFKDVTKLLRKTHYSPISDGIHNGGKVNCVLVKGFGGYLKWQTQTDTFFSREISDRVRVIACLTTLPNIIHSDNIGENISSAEWNSLKKTMNASSDDALIVVWGPEQDADMGASEIIIRCKEVTIGIPSETRQALRDGTNGFERILPGPERMYPDTDLPPVPITEERKTAIREQMPEQIWKREERYRKLGVPEDIIPDLAVSRFAEVFDYATGELGIDGKIAAKILILIPKKLKRSGHKVANLNKEIFTAIFNSLKNERIIVEASELILEDFLTSGKVIDALFPMPCTEEEIKTRVSTSYIQIKRLKFNNPENMHEVYMGLVMRELRGRAKGQTVAKMIDEKLKSEKK
ncbi:MAG: Glu-tRNA(Gln) amidotransferase subunit GatE [Candidatus Kapabacteria bacterium]|nr:Glu-tRNA(Gln) amidotransferase subunit GatE [Ignavibacteriota bacterium]MCW5883629.1 Glu-tRNA(Gln) amidotransferase subunit GatE [Candidatus Kapabacteria bacterium]